jgi:hypothetical protein
MKSPIMLGKTAQVGFILLIFFNKSISAKKMKIILKNAYL